MQEQTKLSNFDVLVSSVDLNKKNGNSISSRKKLFILVCVILFSLFGSSLLFAHYINQKNDNTSEQTELKLSSNNSFYSVNVKENSVVISSPHQTIVINKTPDGGSSIIISSN